MKLENERYEVTFTEKGGEIASFTNRRAFSTCIRATPIFGEAKTRLCFRWWEIPFPKHMKSTVRAMQ